MFELMLQSDNPLMGVPSPQDGVVAGWWPVLMYLIPVILTGVGGWMVKREAAKNEAKIENMKMQSAAAKEMAAVEIESIKTSLSQNTMLFTTMQAQLKAGDEESRMLREELRTARNDLREANLGIAEASSENERQRSKIAHLEEESAKHLRVIETLKKRVAGLEKRLGDRE